MASSRATFLSWPHWKIFNTEKKLRSDWAKVKRIYMTRGVYTKASMYPEVASALLATGKAKLMEASQYDYYWGCGRDRRAENTFGKVLMDVRKKLQEHSSEGSFE